MKNDRNWLGLGLVLLGLTACGGGGGGGNSQAAGSNVDPATAPTAVIAVASTGNATDLSTEVRQAAEDIAALKTSNLPAGVNTLPAGVTSTTTTNCTVSGNFTIDTNVPGSSIAGTVVTITYHDCKYGTADNYVLYTGSARSEYQSFTDANNYALTWSYMDFTVVAHSATYDFTYTMPSTTYYLKVSGGTLTSYYGLDNGAIDLGSTTVTRTSTTITLNATYTYSSPLLNGGVVRVVFTNWTYNAATAQITGGQVTVTGANGTLLQITVNPGNANQLLVEFTDTGGIVHQYLTAN